MVAGHGAPEGAPPLLKSNEEVTSMVGYESNIKKDFAPTPVIRTSSPRVSSQIRGDKQGVRGASPPQGTGSPQRSLRVYLEISQNNDPVTHSSHVAHPTLAYHHDASVFGRLTRLKFEQDFAVYARLREVSNRARYLVARLERERDPVKRVELRHELETLNAVSKKLLELIQKRELVFGGHFIVNVPQSFSELVRALGYDPSDVEGDFFVSSTYVHVDFEDGSHSTLKLSFIDKMHVGKLHPAKHISKGTRSGRNVFSDLYFLAEVLGGSLLSPHRKGSAVAFTRVWELPIRFFVLTVPKSLSRRIWALYKVEGDAVLSLFRSCGAKAVEKWLVWRARREGVDVRVKDVVGAFAINLHPVGDSNPFEPHFHLHVSLALIVFDKRSKCVYRLRPFLDSEDIEKLRAFWVEEVSSSFALTSDELSVKWDVHVSERFFNLPSSRDFAQLLHTLKYNARKFAPDFSRFLERHPLPTSYDAEFVDFVLNFDNRTVRYGLLTNPRRFARYFVRARIQFELDDVDERIRLIEDELVSAVDSEHEASLHAELAELRETKKRLSQLLESESEALDYLAARVEERLSILLDKSSVLASRIAAFLESISTKRVVNVAVDVLRENIPLSAFLASRRSIAVISDNVKSFALFGFFDPFFESPPPPSL